MKRGKKRAKRPPVKRVRPLGAGGIYTTADLCVLLNKTQRTIRRWTRERGFPDGKPDGDSRGQSYLYSVPAVKAWLKINMPQLFPKDEGEETDAEERQRWADMRAVVAGEEARTRLEERDKEPPKKPPRRPRRKK